MPYLSIFPISNVRYAKHIIPLQHNLIAECNIDDDCVGDSDNCVSNFFCQCGSNKKCSGNADTCTDGECRCGNNDECSGSDVCLLGECRGRYFEIIEKD